MVLQGCALQKFHHDEVELLVIPNVVNRADVGVIQRGRGAGLTLKPFSGLRVLGEIIRQELHRNSASQPKILGLVDHSHAAATQLAQNAVVRDGLTDHVLADHDLAIMASSRWRAMLGRDYCARQ